MAPRRRTSRINRMLVRMGTVLIILALGVYIFSQFFKGERSYVVWRDLRKQVHTLETENAALRAFNEDIATKTKRLYAESLDPDYLDELIRRKLPLHQPKDIIMLPEVKPVATHNN